MTTSRKRPRASSRLAEGGDERKRASKKVEDDRSNYLATYFRDMASVDVMSQEEELSAARQLAELRARYWRSLLSYPPFTEGICALCEELLDKGKLPREEMQALLRASRALRDRDLVANQRVFEQSSASFAEAIAYVDVDAIASDRVLADLTAIEGWRREGLSMSVKLPRRGSAPFLKYVAQCRSDAHKLWAQKTQFVKANLRLVVTIARRFAHGRMPLQDLIQEGNIGLMKAVDRFDHRRGFRFSTYGTWWIRHAISRSIADKARAVRLPVHMIDAYNKVRRARREFEAKHGRAPSDLELAQTVELTVERIRRMRWSLVEAPLSLDQPITGDSSISLLDLMADDEAQEPSAVLDEETLLTSLREMLERLPPIESDILRKRMGLEGEPEMTLKQIGERYSLSRERIRQLQERAIGKLRKEFKRRSLM